MLVIVKLIFVGIITVLWYLSVVLNKPVLNRISNYYEDDKNGRTIANTLFWVAVVIAYFLGRM